MSDPIAAAEAAGKARDIANRFETAVFLIAYGIAEKDGLYEADPHRYPYSQAFRHGMNILAALCAECSDDAEELLPTFNESDFIRNSAASDVREWTARWRDECREAVEGCRSIGGADPRRDFQRAVDRRAVREVQRGDAGGRQGEEIDVARLQVRYEGVEHVALTRAGVAREKHVPPVPQRAQRLGLFRCKAVTVCHFHIPSSVRPVTGN